MLRKVISGAAIMAVAGVVAGSASAEELWDPHLFGVNAGLALGAVPPEGVYLINNSYWSTAKIAQSNQMTSTKLDAYIDVPFLLWSTGLKVLDADYMVGVGQPFDYTSVGALGSQAAHWGTYNTVLIPAVLGWTLPYDLHLAASFVVFADNASSSMRVGNTPVVGVGAGMANWTFEPGLALSWLHNGWNLTLETYYDTSTEDNSSVKAGGFGYQSGDEIGTSFTATKTIGKWSGGLVGYTISQLQRDQINGVSTAGTMTEKFGLGPMIGYNFGPIEAQGMFFHDVVVHNAPGGDSFNLRFVLPLK